LRVQNAAIDGELVCLDSEGRSIFNELLFRRGSPIVYAFDLLYLNNRDFRQLPLIDRKEKLRAVIEKSALGDIIKGVYIKGIGATKVLLGTENSMRLVPVRVLESHHDVGQLVG
jgi:ATP-dependent DNA ligase